MTLNTTSKSVYCQNSITKPFFSILLFTTNSSKTDISINQHTHPRFKIGHLGPNLSNLKKYRIHFFCPTSKIKRKRKQQKKTTTTTDPNLSKSKTFLKPHTFSHLIYGGELLSVFVCEK